MANPFLTEVIESIMILVFEFLGTLLLTCLYMSTASWPGCPGDYNTDSVGDFDGGYVGFFIGFFILLVFSARISGSHYNPGVTLAFMFRKDTGRFSRWLGLAYILAQIAGAFCGGFLAYFVFGAQAWIGICDTSLAF
jgi:glycerol uptake facilitator-like aquaporin